MNNFIKILSVATISLFSWNAFSQAKDSQAVFSDLVCLNNAPLAKQADPIGPDSKMVLNGIFRFKNDALDVYRKFRIQLSPTRPMISPKLQSSPRTEIVNGVKVNYSGDQYAVEIHALLNESATEVKLAATVDNLHIPESTHPVFCQVVK